MAAQGLSDKGTYISMLDGILRTQQQSLSSQAENSALVLQQVLLPYILTTLPVAQENDARVLLIRFVLLMFGSLMNTSSNAIDRFLRMMLPAFSKSVALHQTDAQYLIICGKALALIARQASDAFRNEIATITEADRFYLQAAMKAALLMEQVGNQAATSSSATSGGIKLNMDRYRSGNNN